MKTAILVTRGLVGLTGIVQVLLGVSFWLGFATRLIPLHMLIGVIFVLSLLTLAVLCARVGAPRGLAVTTGAWALLILAFGMTQMRILPGPGHWIVRTAHLLTGVAGMGLAGALMARATATMGGEPATGSRLRTVVDDGASPVAASGRPHR